MRLGKFLLIVICLVLVAGTVANAKIKHGSDTLYVIPKTAVAPVIDGIVDPIWATIDYEWMPYFNYPTAPADWSIFSGWTKLMWDDNNIYGLFYMMDDVVDSVSTIDWQMDGVEFYIDPTNTKVTTTSLPADKYHFSWRPAQTIAMGNTANGHGTNYAWSLDQASMSHAGPSGYFVEFVVPLDSVGLTAVAGTKFGTET